MNNYNNFSSIFKFTSVNKVVVVVVGKTTKDFPILKIAANK